MHPSALETRGATGSYEADLISPLPASWPQS